METAIKLEQVSKHYGKRKVVDGLSLETRCGEVFGFLGPNGAGKTTTIKMIVGMIDTDEGKISICGADAKKEFEKAMANVGAIVENPEMYRYMTGLQNLQQYARMRKGVTGERIREVVELVGLSNRIHEKVSKYSLGMRQRLGVAQALLHHPRVLILDEPTNGLDPAGIRQLRDILKNLAHTEGICVMVSSHLMSEMQLMCDRVGIIVNGRLLQVTSVEELVQRVNGTSTFRYHVSDAALAERLLKAMPQHFPAEEGLAEKNQERAVKEEKREEEEKGGSREPEPEKAAAEQRPEGKRMEISRIDAHHLELSIPGSEKEETLAAVNEALISGGVRLYTAAPVESQRLEDAFIELTKGDTQIA